MVGFSHMVQIRLGLQDPSVLWLEFVTHSILHWISVRLPHPLFLESDFVVVLPILRWFLGGVPLQLNDFLVYYCFLCFLCHFVRPGFLLSFS